MTIALVVRGVVDAPARYSPSPNLVVTFSVEGQPDDPTWQFPAIPPLDTLRPGDRLVLDTSARVGTEATR